MGLPLKTELNIVLVLHFMLEVVLVKDELLPGTFIKMTISHIAVSKRR